MGGVSSPDDPVTVWLCRLDLGVNDAAHGEDDMSSQSKAFWSGFEDKKKVLENDAGFPSTLCNPPYNPPTGAKEDYDAGRRAAERDHQDEKKRR